MSRMIEQEAEFNIQELFFSKTDLKGHIQAGNGVFIRVSEFTEEELLHRPHNIVRHKDMPKTVFKLFWSFLQEGKSIAAYVKNRSKNGKYYWVFAMAFPMADGYLSIRIKPSSKYFEIVREVYKEVLSFEKQTDIEQGQAQLLSKIEQLGFSSYDDFMMRALVAELESRDKILLEQKEQGLQHTIFDRKVGDILIASAHCTDSARNGFRITNQLYENLENILSQVGTIAETCQQVKFITTNMTISSSRLGEQGRPLVVVSSNLEKLTGEISDCVGDLQAALNDFKESVLQMHFSLAASRLQIEMVYHFIREVINEAKSDPLRIEEFYKNCALLNQLVSENFTKVESTCERLSKVSRSLLNTTERLSQVTAGMDVIRIVGKIEVARLEGLSDALTSRLAEIEDLTAKFKDSLRVLKSECLWGISSSGRITGLTKDISHRLGTMAEIIAN